MNAVSYVHTVRYSYVKRRTAHRLLIIESERKTNENDYFLDQSELQYDHVDLRVGGGSGISTGRMTHSQSEKNRETPELEEF
jgi:hypothetical protein